MGMFWDLLQQSQITANESKAGALEERVQLLETELQKTQLLLHQVVQRLEVTIREDIDNDGSVGGAIPES